MSDRNGQVARVFSVLTLLEAAPQGLTVIELWHKVRDLGHSGEKRTIYRDIEALQLAGFPLFTDDDTDDKSGQRWKVRNNTRVGKHLVLSNRELLALFFAQGMLTPLRDTPFFHDLSSLFKRIETHLGADASRYFEELRREFRFEPSPRWSLGINPDILDTIRAACAEGHVLKGEYSSSNSGQKRQRTLGPHYLYVAKGSMYLIAEDLEDKSIKVFGVPRFSSAEMTELPYQGSHIDPETLFKDSFGVFRGSEPVHIKIEFSNKLGAYVKERRWHDSQRIINKEGGKVLLEMDVALTPELIQWVLGFGAEALVVEPSTLKVAILEEAKKVCEAYETSRVAI